MQCSQKMSKLGTHIFLFIFGSRFKKIVPLNEMAEQDGSVLRTHSMAVRRTNINSYGRAFINGCAMSEERIAEVVERYIFLRSEADGGDVPVSRVADAANVSWRVAKRVVLGSRLGLGIQERVGC